MNNSKHCEICDLQSFNFKNGVICNLTNKKAQFNRICMKIKLDEKLKEKLIEVNEEFYDLKYIKKHSIINFIVYTIIGLSVIYFSYFFGVYLLERGFYSTVTIVIFVIGLVVLGFGIGPINYYRQKRKITIAKKNDMDKLANLYNINYDFESKIQTDMMGIKETESVLFINGEEFKKVKRK